MKNLIKSKPKFKKGDIVWWGASFNIINREGLFLILSDGYLDTIRNEPYFLYKVTNIQKNKYYVKNSAGEPWLYSVDIPVSDLLNHINMKTPIEYNKWFLNKQTN